MAKKNPQVDYVSELDRIRSIYLHSTPKQRYQIIEDRIEDDQFNGPNKLVTMVSAVEAFLRCLLIHASTHNDADRSTKYLEYRHASVKKMLPLVFNTFSISDPRGYLGEDTLELLEHAVDYRNMLVHDCTYLGGDKFPAMIEACEEVLEVLATLAKV